MAHLCVTCCIKEETGKNVTGTLCLKEGFLQAGFNSATLSCGGIGVCVLRFAGGV